ncbi:MAG: alpha-glucuronidase [Bacteroidales bacterium]|nr:alpha-glucuronidase [Bacteroidales bacterium]
MKMHRLALLLLTSALLFSCKGDEGDMLWLKDPDSSVLADLKASMEESEPYFQLRILDHWDNLDGSIERGYAGTSLWKWDELPKVISPRYEQYARLCESVGINGAVLNNVNANPDILSEEYLPKVAAIADILRPHGIKVYLSINFASPMLIDTLKTADPTDESVRKWWILKVAQLYTWIPDFGGFLVKANSEGQPGPMDYGCTHADGANMLAAALAPSGGIVMWRAFVYSPNSDDRAAQAYYEFKPLDGEFYPNVIIQVKNGPVDFQPREPYNPLFGAMDKTKVMPELQITQEYLGQSTHLVYLAPMWKEFFDFGYPLDDNCAIAGVANTGSDPNWCGHTFASANWYAFGRLAWNPGLSSEEIAAEWVALMFPKLPAELRAEVVKMMCESREAAVDYMMPLGIHHIFANEHHYGPGPWCTIPGGRSDWEPRYYHQADSAGVGFDRTEEGSCQVLQYPEPWRSEWSKLETCPDEYLLWFHHLPWDYELSSTGKSLWLSMCDKYLEGNLKVEQMVSLWDKCRPYVDKKTWNEVAGKLQLQKENARAWLEGVLQYFSNINGLEIPAYLGPMQHDLEYYESVK